MGGACSKREGSKKFIQDFRVKTDREETI